MPTYRFKAVSGPGDVVEGEMEAASQAAVLDHLRGQGYLPIRADEAAARPLADLLKLEVGKRGGLSRQDTMAIIRELSSLLRAGLALDQALAVLINFSDKDPVKKLMGRVLERVRGGSSLADAMAAQGQAFDRFVVGMVRAGEAGGALDSVLAKTAEFMDKSHQSKQNLKSALIYPAVLFTSACISVAIIITVVIPSFKEIFDQAGFALPLATRIVMGVGDIAAGFWWLPLIVGLLTVLVVARQRRDPAQRRQWDRRLLQLPLVGSLMARVETTRMTYTLGMLLNNGVPLVSALGVVKGTLGNAAMENAFAQIEKQVREGKTFAGPLAEAALFPSLATHLIRIGEESGRLEEMLFRVADTYEREVHQSIQRLMAILIPALTFGMALLIGGIIVSILVPMLSINQLAQ
ncbi:MAG: type II secretion system F family protein [Rhodospirillales bacterium]|nr:type II secretion system F family protein [Rhodospirillales bacterium]